MLLEVEQFIWGYHSNSEAVYSVDDALLMSKQLDHSRKKEGRKIYSSLAASKADRME